MNKRSITTVAGVAALLLAGCADDPASGSGATVADEVAEAAAEAAIEEDTDGTGQPETDVEEAVEGAAADTHEDALGTRDDPLPLGTVIEMGDWHVTVSEVTADATDAVMSENEFNEPPVEGRQFVLLDVEATYEGDDSGDPWLDFSWAIVGGAGNTFGGGSMDDHCGVIASPLDEQGETFPGGSVAGNVCVAVPSDQLDGATVRVEDTFSFEDTRAFFTLG